MIASSLSTLILAAVISSFLYIGRSSISLRNYVEMESQARSAMETFAQDVRMSSAVNWTDANTLVLTIERSGATSQATYTYDTTARTFSRASGGARKVLISDVRSFAFNAYSIDTSPVSLASLSTGSAAANAATKQIQLSVDIERKRTTLALSTNKVISARFVLRNKSVTS